MAFQKDSRPATFRESGHIQRIWLDCVLVQSQSSWLWWTLISSVPLYQWVIASLTVLISFFIFFILLLLIWTLGGSVRCSNVGLRLYCHPSSDEGSLWFCLLCSRSLSFCFSFGPRELSPVFRCGSLSLFGQKRGCLKRPRPITILMNILLITIEPSYGDGWR